LFAHRSGDAEAAPPRAAGASKPAKVRLTGLGILQVMTRAARTGRNPATGAEIQSPASRTLAFTAAKKAKEAI
jgi:DNA-binding protein HU-beta